MFLSLVLFALTLTYTARRYTIMVNYEDSTYFTKEIPSDKTKDNPGNFKHFPGDKIILYLVIFRSE